VLDPAQKKLAAGSPTELRSARTGQRPVPTQLLQMSVGSRASLGWADEGVAPTWFV